MTRKALLIGINEYSDVQKLPSLAYAEADATGLAKALCEDCGFETELLVGDKATRDSIESALLGVGEGDTFLFFFAGHGQLQFGRYLLHPHDSNANGMRALSFNEIATTWQHGFGFERVLAVLDSCRNESRGARGGSGLDRESSELIRAATRGMRWVEILYSCGEGECSYEIEDLGHGLFTSCLLKSLQEQRGRLTAQDWAGAAGDLMRASSLRDQPTRPQVCYRYAPESLTHHIIVRPGPKTPETTSSASEAIGQTKTHSSTSETDLPMPEAYSSTLHEKGSLERGAQTLLRCIRTIIGPCGRPFGIMTNNKAVKTTNGSTLLEAFRLQDRDENVAVQFIKEAAMQTLEEVGVGATTTAILSCSLVLAGLERLKKGASPLQLVSGIGLAQHHLIKKAVELGQPVKSVKQIEQVATSAAKHDSHTGRIIAEAMDKVGRHGIITVEDGIAAETSVVLIEGMHFDRGYLSPHFATETTTVRFSDAVILIYEGRISAMRELLPLLEEVAKGGRSLLIVADDVEGEALATLVLNNRRGTIECCATKSTGIADARRALLEDLAVFTGGSVIDPNIGMTLENVRIEDLGRAKTVIIASESMSVLQGAGTPEALQARATQIRKQIAESSSEYQKLKLEERLANLIAGIARISVGGRTLDELKEKRTQTDNALQAAYSAIEEGIIPGGGISFLRLQESLKDLSPMGDEKQGVEAFADALSEPARAIIENCETNADEILTRLSQMSGSQGYDVSKKKIVDLEHSGIVDPTKLIRVALTNAGSAASLLIDQEAKASF